VNLFDVLLLQIGSTKSLFEVYQRLFDLPYLYKFMKTISTKLDKQTADRFQELCNNEGKCQSEFLREMIEDMFEGEEIDQNRETSLPNLETKPISNGKIISMSYDDGEPWIDIPQLTNVRFSD